MLLFSFVPGAVLENDGMNYFAKFMGFRVVSVRLVMSERQARALLIDRFAVLSFVRVLTLMKHRCLRWGNGGWFRFFWFNMQRFLSNAPNRLSSNFK
jgi:hypothetical protein